MIIRSLDSSNDWNFGKGVQSFFKELDAIKQNLITRLLEWKGECFFALGDGVDWNNFLDIGTKSLLDADIKRVILQSDGVLGLDNYVSNLTLRNLEIQCSILTIYGTLKLNEVLNA